MKVMGISKSGEPVIHELGETDRLVSVLSVFKANVDTWSFARQDAGRRYNIVGDHAFEAILVSLDELISILAERSDKNEHDKVELGNFIKSLQG